MLHVHLNRNLDHHTVALKGYERSYAIQRLSHDENIYLMSEDSIDEYMGCRVIKYLQSSYLIVYLYEESEQKILFGYLTLRNISKGSLVIFNCVNP